MNSFEPGNYTTGDVGESIATIVTHGDWTDFEPGGDYAGGITLDNGKYLVSVTAAGHKIGGAHFTVTDATVSPELITVALDPYPLPLVTLRARVFNDLSTNGQIDYPAEEVGPGESMAGFTATINAWVASASVTRPATSSSRISVPTVMR